MRNSEKKQTSVPAARAAHLCNTNIPIKCETILRLLVIYDTLHRSRSFGTPSEPRDGSLPLNNCLYKIKYTIHYNTVPYTVHAWHLSWQRCAHSRHYFDGIRWLHRIFVIIHFVVKQFISTMNTFLRFEVKLFVFKSIIIRYQHNKHHHVFILECSPFLNSLEWLTRSCL